MKFLEIQVNPLVAEDIKLLQAEIQKLGFNSELEHFRVVKKSIDARSRNIKVNLRIGVLPKESPFPIITKRNFSCNESAPKVVIIGSGPAGLFAALRCLELNLKPIVLERGKDVRSRRRDLAAITRSGVVNPDSNYCYGEGGAGTYSDGKLYTRSTKKGSVQRILETFIQFGADENIAIESHPHIGTNKLPQIITSMREAILAAGGEFHFSTNVTDIHLSNNNIESVEDENGRQFAGDFFVFATGHSARNIFNLLHSKNIRIEYKPFALGFRIEHQQQFIDQNQYHCEKRSEYLPAASYNVVTQTVDRAVYSFCMCPGGIIAPCATSPGEVVTNGWSPSKRNNEWANSGIVAEVLDADLVNYEKEGPLKGIHLQAEIEKRAHILGGESGFAPAQMARDFILNKSSTALTPSSYRPGITSVNLNELFPKKISRALREGLQLMEKKIPGFTKHALLVAPETRTSSPVRIPRDKHSLQHIDIVNMFPCGEGAGYAGGIVSAAIDGERVIDAIAALTQ